jgi:hypothetical protein
MSTDIRLMAVGEICHSNIPSNGICADILSFWLLRFCACIIHKQKLRWTLNLHFRRDFWQRVRVPSPASPRHASFALFLVCRHILSLSQTKAKYGQLIDLLDMNPTILGLNLDFSSIGISRSSACKYPVSPLVWLSQTKAKYGPLTDLLDMYPTILGPNFDISWIDISRSSVRKYPVFLLVLLIETKAKYGPLTDLWDMYPTLLGPNVNISSMDLSWPSDRK